MKELQTVPAGSNAAVDRAFNALHAAFWSECPAPASAPVLRAID
jgi:acyl-CoA reductase-like NAD-dependent aldehyde dehydrogenase